MLAEAWTKVQGKRSLGGEHEKRAFGATRGETPEEECAVKRLATVVGALTALALGMGASFVLAAPNDGGSGSPGVGRIGICHKTGNSQAHPFVYITPDASGVLDGHGKVSHQSGDDILPAFSFVNAQGQTVTFPGQNLSTVYSGSTGANLVANGCESGANTTTDTTPEL